MPPSPVDICVYRHAHQPCRIVRVEHDRWSRGIYSPVTRTGTLLVDGVYTSVYSSVESHTLQHTLFTVYAHVHRMFRVFDDIDAPVIHVPCIAQWLLHLSRVVFG
jgi:hypothetical protein